MRINTMWVKQEQTIPCWWFVYTSMVHYRSYHMSSRSKWIQVDTFQACQAFHALSWNWRISRAPSGQPSVPWHPTDTSGLVESCRICPWFLRSARIRRMELHQAERKNREKKLIRGWFYFFQPCPKELFWWLHLFSGGDARDGLNLPPDAGINPCRGLGYGVENGTNGTNISVVGPDGQLKQSQSHIFWQIKHL